MPFEEIGPLKQRRRLFYRHYGDAGAPIRVILTMGLGGDHFQWEPQTEALLKWPDCQFVVYDNRGTGFSDSVKGRWTTQDMAVDALSLLDRLGWTGPRSVHIVGLSMGGMISQELALLDTPRFASIALLSTMAGGITSMGLMVTKIPTGLATLARTFTASDPQARIKNGMKLLYPEEFLDQEHGEDQQVEESEGGDDVKAGKPKRRKSNFDVYKKALVDRGKAAQKAGSRVGVPLKDVVKQAAAVSTHRVSAQRLSKLRRHFGDASLVITGDSDILVHPTNSGILADHLGATLLVLPIAGHGANEQCAEEVNGALRENFERGMRQFSRL